MPQCAPVKAIQKLSIAHSNSQTFTTAPEVIGDHTSTLMQCPSEPIQDVLNQLTLFHENKNPPFDCRSGAHVNHSQSYMEGV